MYQFPLCTTVWVMCVFWLRDKRCPVKSCQSVCWSEAGRACYQSDVKLWPSSGRWGHQLLRWMLIKFNTCNNSQYGQSIIMSILMDSHWQPRMQYKKFTQILTSGSQILLVCKLPKVVYKVTAQQEVIFPLNPDQRLFQRPLMWGDTNAAFNL